MNPKSSICIQKDNIYALPITHYNMEMAALARVAFNEVKPDCVAVELAETMQLQLLHAASRLPDVSIVVTSDQNYKPIYYLCEPCDATFEGLRSALEEHIPAYCIDLDVDYYPDISENIPDPYAIRRIGLNQYYDIYHKITSASHIPCNPYDEKRELYMARKLKELSLSYDRILFIGGMAHVKNILTYTDRSFFEPLKHTPRELVQIYSLSEKSTREVMAEFGWISTQYEEARASSNPLIFPPDRQKLIYQLYKQASENYIRSTGNTFPSYNMRNIMKFARNYALLNQRLMPDLFQILSSAKGCVDHNYAYEVWNLATQFPFRRNVDGLPELELSIEEVWGRSKIIRFHMREQSRKKFLFRQRHKDRSQIQFKQPSGFNICSYPPEDLLIENFGKFLKKKGTQILSEDAARTIPFSGSIEDGIDIKETIRHWHEKKIHVKISGKPPGGVGSVVVIFDEDSPSTDHPFSEKYPWKMTWIGEHAQESDMAFYSTTMTEKVVGPGISRCEYGGFMMSYPPRRMMDVWRDPDYQECQKKSEVLLMAAIDYAIQPIIVYVASSPPKSFFKSFARRFGKKIVYLPIGQLSPPILNKMRVFHVLDGHDKRSIADEYIY